MRRLRAGALLRNHLTADVVHILLVVLLEFLRHLALDPILEIAPCENARHLLRHAADDLGELRLGRRRREQRILLENPHEGEDALAPILRAHERHCVHLAGLNDEAFRAHRVGKHTEDHGDLCVNPRLG